jgi:hypothetical protein
MECACGNHFELSPNKPGLYRQCWECGAEEERIRQVDPLIASQGDHVNGWEPMPRSKCLTVADVAGSGYSAYLASRGSGVIANLTNCTFGDTGR